MKLVAARTRRQTADCSFGSRKCRKRNPNRDEAHRRRFLIANRQQRQRTVNTASFTLICVSARMGRSTRSLVIAKLLPREQRPRVRDFGWVAKGLRNRANPPSEEMLAWNAPPGGFAPFLRAAGGPAPSAPLRPGSRNRCSPSARPGRFPPACAPLRGPAPPRLRLGRPLLRSSSHSRHVLGKYSAVFHRKSLSNAPPGLRAALGAADPAAAERQGLVVHYGTWAVSARRFPWTASVVICTVPAKESRYGNTHPRFRLERSERT